MSEILDFLISSAPLFCIGLAFGLVIGLSFAKKAKPKSSVLSGSGDLKLRNEVLEDEVKQLEAKVKTLEKALEMN